MERAKQIIGFLAVAICLSLWLNERGERSRVETSNRQLSEEVERLKSAGKSSRFSSTGETRNGDTNGVFMELMRLRGAVGTLRREVEEFRQAPRAKGSLADQDPDLARALAESKLALAEENFRRVAAQFEVGVSTTSEFSEAQAGWEMARAESDGNGQRALAIKAELAAAKLGEAEKKLAVGVISNDEYRQLKLAKELAAAEVAGDKLEVARLKLDAAADRLKMAQIKVERGLETSSEVTRAQWQLKVAEAEYNAMAKRQQASK